MIHYTLKCANGHAFDSWFQSASAFDKLQAAGHVACTLCGSSEVEKALMAPRVQISSKAEIAKQETPSEEAKPADAPASPPVPSLSEPRSDAEKAIAALKEHVEKNSDYVGSDFASEARAMHTGDAPERAIWGEARGDEAKQLIEEGIPVAPLPFMPTRKSN